MMTPNPTDSARVYTRQEVATLLKISLRLVDSMLADGRLGHVKAGRLVRISEEHLDQYLANGKQHTK